MGRLLDLFEEELRARREARRRGEASRKKAVPRGDRGIDLSIPRGDRDDDEEEDDQS